MPIVKELLRKVLPEGTKVVTAEADLYGEISWAITLKPSPPGLDGIKGSEFVIVGTEVASDLGITMPHLISALAERRVGAIGVVGEATLDSCSEAQSKGVPLIQLPLQTNVISLEADVMRVINEERQYLYQKERDFTQSLMELAVVGGGSSAIMEKLREITGRTVGFIDVNLRPHFSLNPELAAAFQNIIQKVVSKIRNSATSEGSLIVGIGLTPEYGCFIAPVKVGRMTKGYLMLIASERDISEIDRLAIRVGTLALAVEMSRRQVAEEIEDRFESDIVEALVRGDSSAEALKERARKLELDLSLSYLALLSKLSVPLQEQAAVLARVTALLPKSLVFFGDDAMTVLYPLKSSTTSVELRNLGKKLAHSLSEDRQNRVTLGMGRPYSGPDGIRLSFQEAEQALNMGRRLFGDGSSTSFADLGIYRLLFSLKPGNEMKSFYNEYLGKLDDYEAKHDGELGQTLKAYLECGTAAETARLLHIHRNTLLYRLGRIQEITGHDLEDGETRLALHLAFMTGEIIRTN
jgi:purine catabolism regulator